jgi:CubicO group peptidase (beta-lactamase class C family)
VIRHGYLVFERYYRGFGPEDAQDTQSVTKSVISALVGIALEHGYLQSLDQKAVGFFPEAERMVRDERIYTITLRHLLTMSAGFVNEVAAPGLAAQWYTSADPVRFTLAQPLQHAPGQVMQYSNMGAHLLSAILTRATGMTAAVFAGRFLFAPLGIRPGAWPSDSAGYSFGSGGLWLTPRALAKVGYVYLKQGQWEHGALLRPAWVAASTQRYFPGDPAIEDIEGYGYLWWVGQDHGQTVFYAAGYGGQYLAVVPTLDLVIVMTGNPRDVSQDHRPIIRDYVMPAVHTA